MRNSWRENKRCSVSLSPIRCAALTAYDVFERLRRAVERCRMSHGRSKTKSNEMSLKEPLLFTPERRQHIRRLLEEEQRVSVPELSQHFAVSEVTIRKDLASL